MGDDAAAMREKLDAFERRNAARIEIDRLDRSGSGNVDQSVGIEKRSDFGIPRHAVAADGSLHDQ